MSRDQRRCVRSGDGPQRSGSELTVAAVFALPAPEAAPIPVIVTGEVAEGVVAGAAVGGAGLAVVVLVAHHMVGITKLTLVAGVHVLGPSLPDGQPAAGRQPADEVVLVLWMNEGRGDDELNICWGLFLTQTTELGS